MRQEPDTSASPREITVPRSWNGGEIAAATWHFRQSARSPASKAGKVFYGKSASGDHLFVIQKMTRDPVHHRPGALRRRPFRRSGGPLPVLFVTSKALSYPKRLQDGSLNWRRLQRGRLQEFWFVIPRRVRLFRAAAAPQL